MAFHNPPSGSPHEGRSVQVALPEREPDLQKKYVTFLRPKYMLRGRRKSPRPVSLISGIRSVEQPRGDGEGLPGRLAEDRRYRFHERRRLRHDRRPEEGHDPGFGLQRLPERDRERRGGAPRSGVVRGDWRPR